MTPEERRQADELIDRILEQHTVAVEGKPEVCERYSDHVGKCGYMENNLDWTLAYMLGRCHKKVAP